MTPDHKDTSTLAEDRLVTFAVLGRPDSRRFLRAPTSHDAMLELQRLLAIAGERIYCSTRAGGCGQGLHIVNGTVRRPHFRHFADSECVLRDRAQGRDLYTHRIIQEALVVWLAEQGIAARVEKTLDAHSRVDVYTEPSGAVIEVQLSPESAASMIAREARYGGTVNWLFGAIAPIASRGHVLDRDGHVLVVRLKPGTAPEPYDTMYFRDPMPVEIGIQHVAFDGGPSAIAWHSLASCHFDAANGQLQPPGLGIVIDLIAQARLRRRNAKIASHHPQADPPPSRVVGTNPRNPPLRVQVAAREDVERRRGEQALADAALQAARQLAQELRILSSEGLMDGPRPTIMDPSQLPNWAARHRLPVPPDSSPWRRTLLHHGNDYAERGAQIGAAWAAGLPEYLVDPAWGALYMTMLVHSAPLTTLADRQTDPEGVIVQRLISLGLISVHSYSGVDRYQTAHDLRYVGSPVQWRQPPAWGSISCRLGPAALGEPPRSESPSSVGALWIRVSAELARV